jgi:hypothetical protein
MTQHFSPVEVVARIPTSALRDICARDPHLKDLSAVFGLLLALVLSLVGAGREARKRIVAEIERLAVRDLCHHHVPMAHLLTAVAELGIDHAAMGNSASSRMVAAKRLSEHIASLSPSIRSGLVAFLVHVPPFVFILFGSSLFVLSLSLFLSRRLPFSPNPALSVMIRKGERGVGGIGERARRAPHPQR